MRAQNKDKNTTQDLIQYHENKIKEKYKREKNKRYRSINKKGQRQYVSTQSFPTIYT